MICIYYIGLKRPELGGTVPLLFTMSRRPGRCLFILLSAHAHNTKIGGVLSTPCAVLHVYNTVSSVTDLSLILWPNTPTLDVEKMPLDLQRGPKGNVSNRVNGVATECNQGDTARPLFLVNCVA